MTRRGEPSPINGALNRPRTKLGLELSAWMSIVFVTVTVFLAGFKWLAIFSFEAAKRMLLDPGNSLTQIALETGFSDQAAFGRTFGSLVGLTPAKWRKERLYATIQQSAPIMDGIELHQEVAGTTR
jgi:AraC-like DNA-binding protein